jgi:hypothetical protein
MFVIFRSLRHPLSLIFILGFSVILLPGFAITRSRAASPVARPQSGETIEQFVRNAYSAIGLTPSCATVRARVALLRSNLPTTSSAFEQEARHIVSTLIETQTSYDDATQNTYCQTTAYETRNPAYCDPYTDVNNSDQAQAFVTDLYYAFLQRGPDSGGLAYWTCVVKGQGTCGVGQQGRRRVLDAFGFIPDDAEFTNLVHSLYDNGPVCCITHCPPGYAYDCDLGACSPY